MEEIKQRLESELNHTMNRIRQMGGAVVLEEFPAAIGDNTPLADEVDVIRQNEDREMSFATRSLLVGRANKLAEALQRLRGGEYGLCEECGEPIAPEHGNCAVGGCLVAAIARWIVNGRSPAPRHSHGL